MKYFVNEIKDNYGISFIIEPKEERMYRLIEPWLGMCFKLMSSIWGRHPVLKRGSQTPHLMALLSRKVLIFI